MIVLVGHFLLFTVVIVAALALPLVAGRLIRPHNPTPDKVAVYECGEPSIGSSWVQFDLRFYIVALVFLIFDVEVALFYPWAVAYGSAAAGLPGTTIPHPTQVHPELVSVRDLTITQGG